MPQYFKYYKNIQALNVLKLPYFESNEDQDGSEASVSVLILLSLYPVMSIDHSLALKPFPCGPDLVSL